MKRRIRALEKSCTDTGAPRVDEAEAMSFAAGQRELSLTVGTGHQLTHKAFAQSAQSSAETQNQIHK